MVKYLSSMIAPYKHKELNIIATGGINPDNLNSYLEMDEIIACGGTWIANKQNIEKGNWAQIAGNCKTTLDLLK